MKPVEKIYYIILSLTYFIYITSFIGVLNFAPESMETLQFYFNLYIAIILLVRFNPLRKYKFTPFDQKIIFSSALFLLSTLSASKLASFFKIQKEIPVDQKECSFQ